MSKLINGFYDVYYQASKQNVFISLDNVHYKYDAPSNEFYLIDKLPAKVDMLPEKLGVYLEGAILRFKGQDYNQGHGKDKH